MNLAKLCQSDQLVTFNLPITQCSYPEASISVGIMAKAIGECNDDALSLDSGFSEPISDIAAEFDGSQKDKSRFPSSLPAYPSSLSPLPQPRATSKDIPPTAISASNQFFALLSSHPELQRKWSEVERELIELQEKYRVVLQQKTELAESLFREKEVSFFSLAIHSLRLEKQAT